MKCADCKFWKQDVSINPEAGECRRRAPSPLGEAAAVILGTIRDRGVTFTTAHLEREEPVATGGDIWDRRALWPTTLQDDFCGEFYIKRERVF